MTANRARHLRVAYSLTEEEYDRILVYQGGVCDICGRAPGKNRLSVDHDHKTGFVRGLLCYPCNRLLGIVRDDADRLTYAANYLLNPPARDIIGDRVAKGVPRRRRRRKRTKT